MNINKLSWMRGVLFAMRKSLDSLAERDQYNYVLRAWFQFSVLPTTPAIFEAQKQREVGRAAELVFMHPECELYGVILEVLCQ